MQKRSSMPASMIYRHYDLPEDFPVVGLLGRNWIMDDAPITSLHFHNCLEIGYCYQGDGIFVIEDQIVSFHAQDITIIFPNQLHRSTSSKSLSSRWKWLYLDPEKLLGGILRPAAFDYSQFRFAPADFAPVISPPAGDELRGLLLAMIDEMENRQPGYTEAVTGLALAFFIRLSRLMPHNTRLAAQNTNQLAGKAIIPAIDWIARFYMNDMSVEELAARCHLSPAHFRRVFKAVMNYSPLEYLNLMRVHAACNLLECSSESILSIAGKTGFRTISGMNRHFHRTTGRSPGSWRKDVQLVRTAARNGRRGPQARKEAAQA